MWVIRDKWNALNLTRNFLLHDCFDGLFVLLFYFSRHCCRWKNKRKGKKNRLPKFIVLMYSKSYTIGCNSPLKVSSSTARRIVSYLTCHSSKLSEWFFFLNDTYDNLPVRTLHIAACFGTSRHSTWLNVNQSAIPRYWFIVHKVLNTAQTGYLCGTAPAHDSRL